MNFLSNNSKKKIFFSILLSVISSIFFLLEIFSNKVLIKIASIGNLSIKVVFLVLMMYLLSYLVYFLKLILNNNTSKFINMDLCENHFRYIFNREIFEFSTIIDDEKGLIFFSKKLPQFLNSYIYEIYDFLYEFIFVLCSSIYLFIVDYKILLICFLHYISSYTISRIYSKKNKNLIIEINENFSKYIILTENFLKDVYQIHSFNIKNIKLKNQGKILEYYLKLNFKMKLNNGVFESFNLLFNNLRVLFIMLILIFFSNQDSSTFFVILYISSMISIPIMRMATHIKEMESVKDIKDDFEKNFIDGKNILDIKNFKIENDMSYVVDSFKVENLEILKNFYINFKIGKSYLISGKNGVGKTTFIQDLLKIKKFGGKTYIDNIIVNNERELFGNYILVSSNDELLETTLENNIKFFKNESDKLENLLNLIGLDLKSEFNISNLSQGERQKVLIARSLNENPKILIFDEAFSYIDNKSTKLILEYVLNNFNGILIVIEHNLKKEIINKFDFLIDLNKFSVK